MNNYSEKENIVGELLFKLKGHWDLTEELLNELQNNRISESQLDLIIDTINDAILNIKDQKIKDNFGKLQDKLNEIKKKEEQERLKEKQEQVDGLDFL